MGGVAGLEVDCWPKSTLAIVVESPSVLGLRAIGPKSSKGDELFSAYWAYKSN
jgi:hypothetical protein